MFPEEVSRDINRTKENMRVANGTNRYGANKNDISGVHKSIRLRVGQGRPEQVKSVFDLALIILDECSNTFFDRTRDSHDGYHRTTHSKQPQVLEAFSEAIGNIVCTETLLSTVFLC